jgi:superoxide reductase
MKRNIFYQCEECGNIVAQMKSCEGTLNCCGQEMTKLKPNSTDASKEKHIPVTEIDGDKLRVTVGSVVHPMTPEHYIEWIALVSDDKTAMAYLKPGMEPKAEFPYSPEETGLPFAGENDEIIVNCEGQICNFVFSDINAKELAVFAYCNLHGLWKLEV